MEARGALTRSNHIPWGEESGWMAECGEAEDEKSWVRGGLGILFRAWELVWLGGLGWIGWRGQGVGDILPSSSSRLEVETSVTRPVAWD